MSSDKNFSVQIKTCVLTLVFGVKVSGRMTSEVHAAELEDNWKRAKKLQPLLPLKDRIM